MTTAVHGNADLEAVEALASALPEIARELRERRADNTRLVHENAQLRAEVARLRALLDGTTPET